MEIIFKLLEIMKKNKFFRIFFLLMLTLAIFGVSFLLSTGVSPFVYFNF
ncbi:hypothetical protein N8824_06585 [Candidatus Pelagibacter sp.]|nr:hypothetical protein [Candidatus Pelagibacter sp.]